MLANLKFACRALRKTPAFTAVALLTLAFCITGNVVIYAIVDAILIRPLPFQDPDRLVVSVNSYPNAGSEHAGASLPNYYDRRAAIKAFSSTALYQSGEALVGGSGSTDLVEIDRISPEFFATLGVPLAMGRTFDENEMSPPASHVAILTDSFWRSRFDADPKIIGRTLRVDSQPTTVVGVLPPGFRYLSSKGQFFLPAAVEPWKRGPGFQHVNVYQLISRLAPGSTLSAAQSQLDAFNAQQLKDNPVGADAFKTAGYRTRVYRLHDDYVRGIRPTLLILQAGVICLLLIGSVNLVNLLLIRASAQSKELAIRRALGAGRWRIVRDVVLETSLLGAVGGMLGLVLGALGIRLLVALGTDRLPSAASIALDGRVVVAAIIFSLVLGIALAVPVLWHMLKERRLTPLLQSEGRGGTVTRAAQQMRHGFIVAQLAFTFILLSGAGLLALSLQHVLDTPSGFRPEQTLTARIRLPAQSYPDRSLSRLDFSLRLVDQLRSQPGVIAAGFTNQLPMADTSNPLGIAAEGIQPVAGESVRTHYFSGVSSGYFRALGIPLRQGRLLEDADDRGDQRVCIVDEEVARRYWPGQSALGRRISPNSVEFTEKFAYTIVGVVGHIKQESLSESNANGAIYYPYAQYPSTNADGRLSIVLRTSLSPESMAPVLKKTLLRLDPEVSVDRMQPMQAWIDDSLVARRSPSLLAGIFAGAALLLAAIGTYGVLAYAVAQRQREIGVRMALGAQPRQILRQFIGLSAKLLIAGIVLGVFGAWLAGRAMQGVLFGVGAFQVNILLVTAAVMTLVVLLATFLPSRRASRVDPLVVLRAD